MFSYSKNLNVKLFITLGTFKDYKESKLAEQLILLKNIMENALTYNQIQQIVHKCIKSLGKAY